MSRFKRLPPSVRYLVAGLRRWTQPGVWAPLAVMLAGGMFIWEVASNPESLSVDDRETARSNNPTLGDLSADDSAIAAEIDSGPVLVDELNRSNSVLGGLNSPLVKGRGLFDEIRARGLDIPKLPPAPRQAVRDIPASELGLANPVVTATGSNPQNFNPPSSNTTAASISPGIPAVGTGQLPGIGSIAPDPAPTAATLPQSSIGFGTNPPKPNENTIPLSPLQAAMQKYQAANPNQVAATPSSASSGILPDRAATPELVANSPNLPPTPATPQIGANPANFQTVPTAVPPPTTTIISDSQQFLNPGGTSPAPNSEWAPIVPSVPATPAVPATVALPRNPYQTNLSGSGWSDQMQLAPLPVAPSPVPQAPNANQLRLPGGMRDSKVVNPEFSPNSANSEYQQGQPNRWNAPAQPNFGSVPQNVNGGGQQIQPQPFSVPRQIPGRYIGGGEINTFANP